MEIPAEIAATVSTMHVGTPESLGVSGAAAWFDEAWTTAIFKRRVEGPIAVGRLGLSGDRQADPVNHGGPDKAVCVYPLVHYEAWRSDLAAELDGQAFGDGAFGENLTLHGLTEADICIGDTCRIGRDLVVQVSQPRQPCWKLARKWRIKSLTARAVATGRTGWYFRVLQPGAVSPGDAVTLAERPHPAWTVAAANLVMHHRQGNARALVSLDELSDAWKHTLGRRLASPQPDFSE